MHRPLLTENLRPLPLGAALLAALTAILASGCSDAESGDPPAPTQDSSLVAATNVKGCMEVKGWDVRIEGEGMVAEVPDAQNDQFLQDHEECITKFGYGKPPEMDRQEAGQFYDALVETGLCLSDLGYTVPEPASRQATVDALMNGELPSWDPYDQVFTNVTSTSELDRAYEACPPPYGVAS